MIFCLAPNSSNLSHDVPNESVEPVVPVALVPGGQRLHHQEEGHRGIGEAMAEARFQALAKGGQVGVAVRDLAGVLQREKTAKTCTYSSSTTFLSCRHLCRELSLCGRELPGAGSEELQTGLEIAKEAQVELLLVALGRHDRQASSGHVDARGDSATVGIRDAQVLADSHVVPSSRRQVRRGRTGMQRKLFLLPFSFFPSLLYHLAQKGRESDRYPPLDRSIFVLSVLFSFLLHHDLYLTLHVSYHKLVIRIYLI